VGLLVAPAAAPLVWVVLLGLGTGATFPLALLLVVLRSGDPRVTPQLSAMVQGLGYLVAATGPVVVGVLHDVTGGWTVPLVLMLVLTALQAGVAWLAGREAVV
jgi:CP family cyanate transporter-like MFS transporter